MFGSGETFSDSGVVFSSQLVSLYTKTIGDWSEVIIATIVFVTMASTTLTVFDAYPRTLAGSIALLSNNSAEKMEKYFVVIGAIMAVISIVIINFFSESLKTLLDFATIMSFLAAPVFAFINYKVVTSKFMKKEMQPPKWLKILSWIGIIFLVAFSLIFIGSLFAL
jgi:Mn2+/Fe2+ NRAMP family transporter